MNFDIFNFKKYQKLMCKLKKYKKEKSNILLSVPNK